MSTYKKWSTSDDYVRIETERKSCFAVCHAKNGPRVMFFKWSLYDVITLYLFLFIVWTQPTYTDKSCVWVSYFIFSSVPFLVMCFFDSNMVSLLGTSLCLLSLFLLKCQLFSELFHVSNKIKLISSCASSTQTARGISHYNEEKFPSASPRDEAWVPKSNRKGKSDSQCKWSLHLVFLSAVEKNCCCRVNG